MAQRQKAWCVLLGIDYDAEEFSNFQKLYFDVLQNNKCEDDNKDKSIV